MHFFCTAARERDPRPQEPSQCRARSASAHSGSPRFQPLLQGARTRTVPQRLVAKTYFWELSSGQWGALPPFAPDLLAALTAGSYLHLPGPAPHLPLGDRLAAAARAPPGNGRWASPRCWAGPVSKRHFVSRGPLLCPREVPERTALGARGRLPAQPGRRARGLRRSRRAVSPRGPRPPPRGRRPAAELLQGRNSAPRRPRPPAPPPRGCAPVCDPPRGPGRCCGNAPANGPQGLPLRAGPPRLPVCPGAQPLGPRFRRGPRVGVSAPPLTSRVLGPDPPGS